ncbi:hypothetical protein GCM10011351_06570 [Paraliobacillus quinghaiensis]|uniref:Uncharacterized protein n=1 Tax=Paraliobacillus quinghaiensis TaxID=470815 RepID=A0A917THU4_9BACI|nr:hypothetical protein [Paraliobacillus quinghaiensis]GGM23471.1 hypothetical protein GCM10011351_06570 [Paraliobacillus quinghaiensis]
MSSFFNLLQKTGSVGRIVVNELRKQRDIEGNRIDIPFRHFEDANLVPPPYEQVIPYDFDDSCKSHVYDSFEDIGSSMMDHPKPKLFL